MKQDYTLYVYTVDKRRKTGERLVTTLVCRDKDAAEMQCAAATLERCYPKGCRIEYFPTMKTVRNLMSGELVEIRADTPRSCDPSSELYWSM